jgi:hypothetical protein
VKTNRELVWRHFKGLHELYEKGRTFAKIGTNPYIDAILIRQKKLVRPKTGNLKILEAQSGYRDFYKKEFKETFERFEKFLNEQGLDDDARSHYTEQDLLTLMFIYENKAELRSGLTTIRSFSTIVFKGHGSKYIENHTSLRTAICRLLEIADFPDKDPKNLQWRLIVDCTLPKAIVLCENLAFLKVPWEARENQIELWYVGGNNTTILEFIGEDKFRLPVYYSCDWDYHGLRIYTSIKEKLSDKGFGIQLLYPDKTDNRLPVNMQFHKSKWKNDQLLSGLRGESFTLKERSLIKELINGNQWIEEESLDFLELLKSNKVL